MYRYADICPKPSVEHIVDGRQDWCVSAEFLYLVFLSLSSHAQEPALVAISCYWALSID